MYQTLLQDIFAAYYRARRGKRDTRGQLAFEMDMEHNLVELARHIHERRYRPSPSVCFIVEWPAKREVFAPHFRDQVVHHLLHDYLQRIFAHRFIADNYAGIRGRGNLYGIRRLEHHIRSCTHNFSRKAYVLKLDVRSYFLSIDKNILFPLFEKLLDSYADRLPAADRPDIELVRYLARKVVFDDPTKHFRRLSPIESWHGLPKSKSLFHLPPNVGMPVGNLIAQFMANIYLTPLDEYCKRELGAEHYGRYMDDFYFVHSDRELLRRMIRRVDDFLWRELRLHIHPGKVYLQEVDKGVDFLGAWVLPRRRYINRRATGRLKKTLYEVNHALEGRTPTRDEMKAARARINSYMGHLRHFNQHRLTARLVGKCVNITANGRFDAQYHKFTIPDVSKNHEKATDTTPAGLDGDKL